ncbi:hypothetical protein [Streptomyces sp. NPDC088348]|uniref:hypothetical protein n=1 Tax=Streptomyces sp. NPDC088348 TaxID=3365853 RepID=UPI00381652A2
MSNWARRHKDFPTPVRSGDTELFHEAEIAGWLMNRTIPPSQLLDGEQAGTTYADRFRRTSGDRPSAELKAVRSGAQRIATEDKKAVDQLMGRLADRVRGPATMADFVNPCLIVMYVRHAEPEQWRRIEDTMPAGQGGQGRAIAAPFPRRHGPGHVAPERRPHRHAQQLAATGTRSWDDLTTAVRTAAGTGVDAFQLVWESFSAREGLQSSEFCSSEGSASG